MLSIPRSEAVLFASDTHLSAAVPQVGERLLASLRQHGPQAAHLVLLGDLFEVWVGDDGTDAQADALAETLSSLAAQGLQIWMMCGNRDFLLGLPIPGDSRLSFPQRCGARMLADPVAVDLHGVRSVWTHGDLLCTDDTVYQQWRQTCRNPAWQAAFLARPLEARIALGRAARETSEAGKREQPGALMDVNAEAVDALMSAHDATLLIHGHTHRPAEHHWEVRGAPRTRRVLIDWAATRGGLLRWQDGVPQALYAA